jgi:hypothetical protein
MTVPVLQIDQTYHWPANGEIRPWTELWVTTLLSPVGRIRSASILFSVDNGEQWQHRPMQFSCILGDREAWHVALGLYPAGTTLRYAVEGIDLNGQSVWDNNLGRDYTAHVGSARDLSEPTLS